MEGRQTEVEAILTEYLKQKPDDSEALLIQGKWFLAQADFPQAIKLLERVIRIAPADQDAHYQLGQALARVGQEDRAKHHLQLHRKILDSKVRLHALELVAAREPGNVNVREELARKYAELGLEDLAEFWSRAAQSAAAL